MTYLLLSDNGRRGNCIPRTSHQFPAGMAPEHLPAMEMSVGDTLTTCLLFARKITGHIFHLPCSFCLTVAGQSVTEPLPMAFLYNIHNRYHKEDDFKNSRPIFRRLRLRSQPLRYCKKSKHETAETFRSLKVVLRINEKPGVCGMKYLYVGYATLEVGG
jgi:hypothetical protein